MFASSASSSLPLFFLLQILSNGDIASCASRFNLYAVDPPPPPPAPPPLCTWSCVLDLRFAKETGCRAHLLNSFQKWRKQIEKNNNRYNSRVCVELHALALNWDDYSHNIIIFTDLYTIYLYLYAFHWSARIADIELKTYLAVEHLDINIERGDSAIFAEICRLVRVWFVINDSHHIARSFSA